MKNSYNIDWKFLESLTDEPLYIGIPNMHCTIVSTSGDIRMAQITNRFKDETGSWIRIDLKNSYYARNQTVNLKFVLLQERMLCTTYDSDDYIFEFVPGWFDNMYIYSYLFHWSSAFPMKKTNGDRVDNYSCNWTGSLKPGEYVDMQVNYEKSHFTNPVPENWIPFHKTNPADEQKTFIIIGFFVVIMLFGLIQLAIISQARKYRSGVGFYYWEGGWHQVSHTYHKRNLSGSGSGHSGGGGGHSCACACACAGGGRAGCSVKDFYRSTPESLPQDQMSS
jgi:hypothetical protein